MYEVIIVLIIILVASAVVVPSLTGFLPSVRVRKAGDELLATFAKARADAVLTSRRFRVVFTKEPASYRLEFEPDPQPYFAELAAWLCETSSRFGAR